MLSLYPLRHFEMLVFQNIAVGRLLITIHLMIVIKCFYMQKIWVF